jgi:soluble lytic murein transglycosylase-like protein
VSGPVTSPSQVDNQRAPARVDGPITSPSQLDASRTTSKGGPPPGAHPIDPYGPPASAKPIDPYGPPASAKPIDPYGAQKPSSGLTHRFDTVFDRYRGEIPIEYLRALVDHESSFEPKQRTGSAIGLMQIIPVVLDDYNTRNGTHYKPEHLVDPAINVAIGCELLVIIIASYAGHFHVANMQAHWNNLRFVELLTFGWNAGFSEAGGVGRVATYLEHHGTTDLTIDLVSQAASSAGASKHLSNAAKVRWSKSVAALYARERALSGPRRPTT